MPTYARCPECHATLSHGAAWCSLCHADLRPPPVPVSAGAVSAGAVSGTAAELETVGAATGGGGRRHAAPEPVAAPPAPVRGRHRRPEPTLDAAPPSDLTALRADLDALTVDAPRDADGRPDVEVLTAQLMARLASSEGRRTGTRVPDLDSVPGGKWGLMVGGMVAVAAVLVIVFTVLGALVGS